MPSQWMYANAVQQARMHQQMATAPQITAHNVHRVRHPTQLVRQHLRHARGASVTHTPTPPAAGNASYAPLGRSRTPQRASVLDSANRVEQVCIQRHQHHQISTPAPCAQRANSLSLTQRLTSAHAKAAASGNFQRQKVQHKVRRANSAPRASTAHQWQRTRAQSARLARRQNVGVRCKDRASAGAGTQGMTVAHARRVLPGPTKRQRGHLLVATVHWPNFQTPKEPMLRRRASRVRRILALL